MKTTSLLIFLFCFSFQCFSLSQNTSHNKVEVLDLSLYKDLELQEGSDSKYFLYEIKNKKIGISMHENQIYLEERDSSPFRILKRYFPDTKKIFSNGEYFGYYSIGISYSYDREGNLIEEINHDEHFSFSDLIAKIKEEYKVDLMISKNFREVRRFYMEEWGRSFYTVFLYEKLIYRIRRVLLDGNTGEFLYEDFLNENAPSRYIEDIEDIISREVIKKEKAKE